MSQQTLTPSSQVAQSDTCGNHGVQDKRRSCHESWLLGHRNKRLPGMASNHEKDHPDLKDRLPAKQHVSSVAFLRSIISFKKTLWFLQFRTGRVASLKHLGWSVQATGMPCRPIIPCQEDAMQAVYKLAKRRISDHIDFAQTTFIGYPTNPGDSNERDMEKVFGSHENISKLGTWLCINSFVAP